MNAVLMNVIVDFKLATLLSPFVSWFIYDMINTSPLLIRYREWIYKEIEETKEIEQIEQTEEIEETETETIPFYKYPLGYCLKCMGVWVSIFIYLNPYFEFTLFITLISISYFIIVKLFYK